MKIVTAFLKYDYGIKERGPSLEISQMFPAIEEVADEVIPFWLEENGFPTDSDRLQKSLINFVEKHKPDLLLFVLMNDEIKKETFKTLNTITKTANWFCDDQWRFDNYSKKIGPELSYIITVDKYSVDKYKKRNCTNVILTQWGTSHYPTSLDLDNVTYKHDISFVGGKNLTREWYIYELEKRGIIVDCYGAGWDNGRLSQEEMNQIFIESKINLNLSNSLPVDIRFYHYLRKRLFSIPLKEKTYKKKLIKFLRLILIIIGKKSAKNVEQIKARNFEIPGSGGFLLSQYAPEIEDYYLIGNEIAVFASIDELVNQINYYLSNEDKRIQITKNGFNRSKKHTYYVRFRDVFNQIKFNLDVN